MPPRRRRPWPHSRAFALALANRSAGDLEDRGQLMSSRVSAHRAGHVDAPQHDAVELADLGQGQHLVEVLAAGDRLDVDGRTATSSRSSAGKASLHGRQELAQARTATRPSGPTTRSTPMTRASYMSRRASQPPILMVSPRSGCRDDLLQPQGLFQARAFGLELGLDADDVVVLPQVLQRVDHACVRVVHVLCSSLFAAEWRSRRYGGTSMFSAELLALQKRNMSSSGFETIAPVGQPLGERPWARTAWSGSMTTSHSAGPVAASAASIASPEPSWPSTRAAGDAVGLGHRDQVREADAAGGALAHRRPAKGCPASGGSTGSRRCRRRRS